ncbi:MAG: stage 0 sporulation family protein [Candidatus Omnitrophica bacterium]|nr:stage 0 sporulation family protein [Candidatus Omnitrophota bacterium]
MIKVVEVKQRQEGQVSRYVVGELKLSAGDYVIIESDRGLDYGQVLSAEEILLDPAVAQEPTRKIVRLASKGDIEKIERNAQKTKEIMKTCNKKIEEHKLDMKLIDAELSFDCSKIVFYFTAEERVDFRELVKDLAKIFKARIELKQVGVRDEAKMFGGFGQCGGELCCARFLKDFEPVTIKMAKDQSLPLNPTKISGVCGRLMCCLAYEHRNYKESARGLPRLGQRMKTKEGTGKVVDVNYLKRMAVVELEDGRQLKIDYNKERK